jgi:hypothetical protein
MYALSYEQGSASITRGVYQAARLTWVGTDASFEDAWPIIVSKLIEAEQNVYKHKVLDRVGFTSTLLCHDDIGGNLYLSDTVPAYAFALNGCLLVTHKLKGSYLFSRSSPLHLDREVLNNTYPYTKRSIEQMMD